MPRLPGKQFGNTRWHRKLDCGCIVRLWPSRVEVYFYCEEHKKASEERWKKTPWYEKTVAYSIGLIFFGIPLVAVLLFLLYMAGALIYMAVTGKKI